MADYIPKWHRELSIFSRIKPLLLVEGNVLDVYQYPTEGSISKGSILRLPEYLHYSFTDMGYETIAFFDSMQGFYNSCDESHLEEFARMVGARTENGHIRCDFKGRPVSAASMVRTALGQNKRSTVVVMNLASRYITSPGNMDQAEVDSFTSLMLASLEAKDVRTPAGPLKNLVLVIVDKVNDVPAWFYLDNPNVRIVTIGTPSKEEREMLIKGENFMSFFAADVYDEDMPYYEAHPDELEKIRDRFVGLTEGFSFTEINGLRRLCKNERTRIRQMASVIDLYKYGIRENPWDALNVESLRTAESDFRRRVKGQDLAIRKTLDVVKRAVTGMSGLQGSSHSRPKGVLFFAGPTGTGKTELAKTLAEKLFGDERRCIRFDMSEYGQSHSDQKLLGAPPGYIGYEAGGQLTNAVRENPFSILLFDEIEKAHPTIFDKFLQILEDGRMTDGQGNTVYFSECIIIFTSNLGIYTKDEQGRRQLNASPDQSYPQVQQRVRRAIEDYFKLELGRPELLNRIGENIVVFDFIRPDIAEQILLSKVGKIISELAADKKIDLNLSEEALAELLEKAIGNLENGGRGIGNIVEDALINPLSRYIFDEDVREGEKLTITAFLTDQDPCSIICTRG
ncbi:MAG: AAA family ATPase [Oscillospiraceae bacterium]|nr:AAA family ATPase [Oscillospiraceae bacterium]